jgi:hypothetical protein
MKLTLVTFRIYDREAHEAFIDTTLEDIHEKLYSMCFTYVPLKIVQVDIDKVKGEEINLNEILKFNPSQEFYS